MDLGAEKKLISRYLDGELDEAGGHQLRTWLEADPSHVRFFVREVYLHQQLREAIVAAEVSAAMIATPGFEADSVSPPNSRDNWARSRSWKSSSLMVAALVAGLAIGSLVTWLADLQRRTEPAVALDGRLYDSAEAEGHTAFATLVRATNCRWDTTRSTANLERGSSLRPGESLHLLEGIAEISTKLRGGSTTLQLEGPLALTLTSEGTPSLLYGKVTGTFSSDHDQFALDTPLGRVVVSGHASIGVMAAANDVELHVFTGSATLRPWTIGLGHATDELTAEAGSSLHASVESGGHVKVDRGQSRESWFVTPAAVAESQLVISKPYVKAVEKSHPLGYWRFERSIDGVFRNEISDRLHCRMVGNAVAWRPGSDNGVVEFGTAAGPGYLISDDALDGDLKESYSVEMWIKPLYYHHGTLFALIDWTPSQSPLGTHRMALEVCGPVSGFTTPYRPTDAIPGRIRFIHECRKQFDAECASSEPYAVRRWQHVVASKDQSHLKLYVDGQLVKTEEASGVLAPGLRVLMGQLLPINPEVKDEVTSRLFGGEMDEVALYDRALNETEVREHFQLAEPSANSARNDASIH